MCCDGWKISPDSKFGETLGECPECGEEVVVYEDGTIRATTGCNYSPVSCSTCGSAPCDQSC